MDTTEITERLQGITDILAAKGFQIPKVQIEQNVEADEVTFLCWLFYSIGRDRKTKMTDYALNASDAIANAEQLARRLKAPEEEERAEFMKGLGRLIDQGRAAGIPVAFLNPLEQSMRDLSENILTDQREG